MAFFSRTLGDQEGLMGPFPWVDLHLFQLLRGLGAAVPTATDALMVRHPELAALRYRVSARPAIARWLASDRCLPFDEHGLFRPYPELDLPLDPD